MAVEQKDMDHWKEPVAHISRGILPYCPPLDTTWNQTLEFHTYVTHQQILCLYNTMIQPL